MFGLDPRCGGEGFDFRGLGPGQAFKDILKVLGGIDAEPSATAQHRVDHRAALTRVGMSDEQKVLFANGCGANVSVSPSTSVHGKHKCHSIML